MYFAGIDLAWSNKNKTGIAIVEGNKIKAKLICADNILSNKDILNYINSKIKNQNALVAIDAPLIVPNETGRRLAEEVVGKLFRKYNAGAHPSNRKRLSQWSGTIRGEEISKLLEKSGFKHSPKINKFENSRKFFEVYPHPSMVVLFKLDNIIKYKAKPKRDYNFRYSEFIKYQNCLKKLSPKIEISKEIISKDVKKLKGRALKDYEDLLDSIFCAYIAYYSWTNPDKCKILGNMEEGYILTPVFDFMKAKINK